MAAPRILFIGVNYAPEPTGIGPYTTGMAEGLAARGWDVRVLTSFPHYPWWEVPPEHATLPARSRDAGVEVHRLHHYIPREHKMATRAAHEISFGKRAVATRWGRPDAVVLVSPALLAARMCAAKARLSGIPVVTWVQDIYTLGVSEAGSGAGAGAGAKVIARCESGLANISERVVVIHDRFRRQFTERLGVRRPVDVVRNWSHVPDLRGRRDSAVRHRLGWADDDVVVLHAGAMGAKQGLESVVHASQLAAARGSNVRFVLLGDGNRRAELEAMGANPRLQFIDPLGDDDFHAALGAADMLLINERPGLTEMSVPSKMTTYFATGLPVLAAVDQSSTTFDEMQAAGAGVCVPPAEPALLLEAAERLAADPARARALGARGPAYRERLLSARSALDGFEVMLGQTLHQPVRAPHPTTTTARWA